MSELDAEYILGKLAYQTYRSTLEGHRNYDGRRFQNFDDLPPKIKNAWIQVAIAIFRAID